MFGVTRPGGYAQLVTAPAHSLIAIPDSVSYDAAAAAQVAFGTAFHMLIGRARLLAGETVLVQAAGSGVGSAAIQLAHHAGAHVIATASSEDKLARARRLGADETINYSAADFLSRVMMLTGGRGVDVVVEHVGGEVFSKSVKCLALGGRLVTCGAHGGEVASIDLIELFRKEAAVLGSYTATWFELRQVMLLVESGKLKPVIDKVFPLAEAAEAQERLASRAQFGKVLLHP
jgi:NADPH:quinone reductase-like Zn-dependent oxidoreductase